MADTDGVTFFERVVADEFLDLSDMLSSIVNISTEFLAEIPDGPPADNFEFKYETDALNSQVVTLNGTINNSTTTVNVAAGHGARCRPGTILQNTENIAADQVGGNNSSRERIVVVSVSTDALTVNTRGALSSTACAHTDGAVLQIVGNMDSEFGGLPPDQSTDRTPVTENCQIFKRTVRTSWIRKFSKSKTVPDEEAYQLLQRGLELSEEQDRTCLHGMGGYVTITDRYYAMNGMIARINTANGNRVTTNETLSPTVINNLNAKIREKARQHELPTRLIARTNVIRYISRFNEGITRTPREDRGAGQFITHFLCDLGNTLTLIADDNMIPGTMALYNPKNLRKRTLIPAGLFRMPEAKTSDAALLMEVFGLEVRNANELFAYHSNLTVPN